MIMMTMTISIVSPALDALRDTPDDPFNERYASCAIDAARDYLMTIMPDAAHNVCFDNVTFMPATDDATACHEIECSIEP